MSTAILHSRASHIGLRILVLFVFSLTLVVTVGLAGAQESECVRVGIAEPFTEASNLDPYVRVTGSGDVMYVVNNTYERLIDLGENFTLVPKLAESWERNDNATEWTFHLREGVMFHDGHEMTSADVVHSYQRMLDPENEYPALTQLPFLTPDSVSAVDDYTVKFTTEAPAVELPLALSFFEGYVTPADSETDDLAAAVNGTGPFMLGDDYAPGAKVVTLVRNPDYWQEGLPKEACIELREIQDATARTAALQSGQIDISTSIGGGVDLATAAVLEADPNVDIVESNPVISLVIWMWADTPPFDDVNVRKALKLVVDRDFMVANALQGHAIAGDDHPIPPTSPYAWRNEYPQQNIEEARQLLAEAGYDESNPLSIQLYASEIQPGALNMALAYREMAALAGVNVEVVQVPLDSYWDTVWLNEPMGLSSWGVRAPSQAFPLAYGCNPTYNESHWCDPAFDELIAQAQVTVDDEERADLYRQAEQMLAEEGGLINVLFFNSLHGIRANCTGFQPPVPFYQVDFAPVECS